MVGLIICDSTGNVGNRDKPLCPVMRFDYGFLTRNEDVQKQQLYMHTRA